MLLLSLFVALFVAFSKADSVYAPPVRMEGAKIISAGGIMGFGVQNIYVDPHDKTSRMRITINFSRYDWNLINGTPSTILEHGEWNWIILQASDLFNSIYPVKIYVYVEMLDDVEGIPTGSEWVYRIKIVNSEYFDVMEEKVKSSSMSEEDFTFRSTILIGAAIAIGMILYAMMRGKRKVLEEKHFSFEEK